MQNTQPPCTDLTIYQSTQEFLSSLGNQGTTVSRITDSEDLNQRALEITYSVCGIITSIGFRIMVEKSILDPLTGERLTLIRGATPLEIQLFLNSLDGVPGLEIIG